MQKNSLKSVAAVILAVIMMLSGLPAGAEPKCDEYTKNNAIETRTQSHSENFSQSFTLTGNGANDIVAIALAQEGKTGSELGYTEEWCADFVCDCAKLAGQSAAVPFYGGVAGLKERVGAAGGNDTTSNPQPGDLCFIDWDGNGGYGHVEIVYSVSGTTISTIGGNSGSEGSLYYRKVKKHSPLSSGVITCIMRPNYTGVSMFAVENVSSISNTNATINAWVDNSGTMSQIGFYIGEDLNCSSKYVVTESEITWTRFHLSYALADYCGYLCPGCTYYYRFFYINESGEYQSEVNSFTTSGSKVVSFDSYNVSDITENNAQVGVWLDNPSAYQLSSIGIMVGTDKEDLSSTTIVNYAVSWTRSHLNYNLNNIGITLLAGQTYYVRYYVVISGQRYYSRYCIFTTSSKVSYDSYSISDIGDFSAFISAWVSNDNAYTMAEVGFAYGTNKNNLTRVAVNTNVSWTRAHLQYNIANYAGNLTPGKTYFYRFFVLIGNLVYYSKLSSFTTTQVTPKYTVTFKDWDGTVLKTETVYQGFNATPPANPTRTGYTFAGWSGTYTNVTSSRVITATYTINTYTVTFTDYDGTVLKTQTVNYGSSATPPADPVWEGHTFTGWSGIYTNVTADQIVTATYDVNLYNVTYYLDGELYTEQSVTYGEVITLPEVSIEGYDFSGWTLENGDPVPDIMPAYDLSVYGTLTRNVFTVTYVGDYEGTEEVAYGGDAVLPVLDVEGVHYTFTVNGEPWDGTNITEDVTVEVGMEIAVYTVQFIDGVTGEVLSTQQVEYADAATAPAAPEHYGYTFAGWDVEFGYITADTTVTAVYDPVTFTVIFTDGLDNIISVQEVPYLGAAEEPEIPVREGWVFAGWDADFSCVTAPMVINATWQEQQITVTFTGSYTGTEVVAYGADCPLPVYNSSSICYTFKVNGEDWCPENLTEDVTVTVSVAPVKTTYHTVTFIGINGVVISTQSVQHGQAAEIPEAPAVPGYRFVGWDRDVQMLSSVTYTCTRTAIYEKVDDPTPVLLGDVDGDGFVTMADVTLLSMYLNGENPQITAEGMLNADANADGTVDIRDIAAIYQIIANS